VRSDQDAFHVAFSLMTGILQTADQVCKPLFRTSRSQYL
jgi:hypothetical protein